MSKNEFPLDVNAFLGGTSKMLASELGGYVLLLCYQWKKGGIPDNLEEISKISRIPQTCTKNISVILKKFRKEEDGMLRNVKMEKVRIQLVNQPVQPNTISTDRHQFLKLKEEMLEDKVYVDGICHCYKMNEQDFVAVVEEFFYKKILSEDFININERAACRKNFLYFVPLSVYMKTKNSTNGTTINKGGSATDKLRTWGVPVNTAGAGKG